MLSGSHSLAGVAAEEISITLIFMVVVVVVVNDSLRLSLMTFDLRGTPTRAAQYYR